MRTLAALAIVLLAVVPAFAQPAPLPVFAEPGPEPPPPPPAPPNTPKDENTCSKYCMDVIAACKPDLSGYDSLKSCNAACNEENWADGLVGEETGDSLACRLTWAGRASKDASACPNAGKDSPACVFGRSLPPAPPLDPAARTVIGLYHSEDGKPWDGGPHSLQCLKDRVGPAVRERGFEFEIRNVRRGLPDAELLARSLVIVTVFADEKLPGAEEYLLWALAQMKAGRKFIILNNMGAYVDEKTGKDASQKLVEFLFRQLGLRYEADWTRDAKVLKREEADPSVFRAGKVPDPKKPKDPHYLRFVVAAPDVKVHLSVSRTDRPNAKPSAVVMSSPRGGMALTRYYESMDGVEQIDLGPFLDRILGKRPESPR